MKLTNRTGDLSHYALKLGYVDTWERETDAWAISLKHNGTTYDVHFQNPAENPYHLDGYLAGWAQFETLKDARAHVKYLRGINAPENGIARSLAVMMVL